ncbi:hypothetical protein [Qipengyuania sp. 902]|uniref:hypothetical protein n=1 Tax=Qipengyuania sp. 902 TaxID=3417565 RepID=UPI003EBF09D2
MKTALAAFVALIFPPLGVLLAGLGRAYLFLAVLLTIAAVAIFFLLYAGVGLILYGITGVLMAAAVIFVRKRKK